MRTSQDSTIDYIEFPCKDIARVKAFYNQVFGWNFQDWGPGYASFNDGRLNGGFTNDAAVSSSGVLVVLFAADLEAAQAKVLTAGGKITKPTFEFPGGRRFHFADSEGNVLAIWSHMPGE